MKMQSATVEVETSGKLEQSEFSISDTGMMMEHMITTIYSDKIGTICREIMSNARDAHREIGTPNRPIRVRFPNRFDMSYEVRDWGVGIDPERMIKVFINLGSSTKRGDNVQTGGFGIGAKTPWCYTDVFTIRTTAKEKDGVIRRREYSAVKAGQKFTLHEMGEPVVIDLKDKKIKEEDRHTGTSIIIPVPEAHRWDEFKTKTVRFTEYWDVRPELCGCSPLPEYVGYNKDDFYIYSGEGWKVAKGGDMVVLVDGIPYPLNVGALTLNRYDDEDFYNFVCHGNQSFVLVFGVGELSLSLNREQLQYTDETKKKIIARLKTAFSHVRVLVEKEIATAATYWDAHIAFQNAKQNLPGATFISNVQWNGCSVDDKTIGGTSHSQLKISNYEEFDRNPDGSLKIRRKDGWSLEINEHTQWVISDEGFISRLKLIKLLEDQPHLKHIQLIEMNGESDHLDAWKKRVHWDLFAPNILKMSALAKPEPKKRVRGATTSVVTKAYAMKGGGRFHDAGSIDLGTGTGVYVLVERKECCEGYSHSDIVNARRILGLNEVFGIPKRFAASIGPNWKPLSVALNEAYIAENAKIDMEELQSYLDSKGDTIENQFSNELYESLKACLDKGLIEDGTCDLAKWIAETPAINDLAIKYPSGSEDKVNVLAHLTKIATPTMGTVTTAASPKKKLPVSDAMKACQNRYPLLFAVANDWHFMRQWDDGMKEETLFYINAKNKT